MKNLFLLALIFISSEADSANYYISPGGNDASNGTSTSTAWKTIARINSHTFLPGDVIMFQKGAVWRETLVPPSSGSTDRPITFSAYGTGPNPIINGASVNNGKWQQTTNASVWSMNSPLKNDEIPAIMIDGIIYSRVLESGLLSVNTFYLDKSGKPDKIYISSTSNPNSRVTEISTRQYAIYLRRKNNIVITNLSLINCLYAGLRLDGGYLYDGSPGYFKGYCTIDGVRAANSVKFGIVTGNGYTHTVIRNSSAHENGNGFYSDGNANNTLFQHDTAYNNYRHLDLPTDGNGFGVYKSAFNTIEYCMAYNNKGGNGFEVDLNNTDSAIVIRYNVAFGNGSVLEGYGIKTGNLLGTTSSNQVYYNLSYLNGNDPADRMGREFYHHNGNVSFYNNTAYTTGKSLAYGITIAGTGIAIIKNNIFYAYGGTDSRCIRRLNKPQLIADYNLYFSTAAKPFLDGTAAYNFSGWQQLGYDYAKSVNTNAMFTSEGTSFTLQEGSPAVNMGTEVGLTHDILGNPLVGLPDIGAFESAAPVSPTVNRLPVADAGKNQQISLPVSSAILDGSGSFDPDGIISAYQWEQVQGPSSATLSSTSSASITVSNLKEGVYTFGLTVSDNHNAVNTTVVTVTVVKDVNNLSKPFSVYPNPASDIITVRLPDSMGNAAKASVIIFDISGKMAMPTFIVDIPTGIFSIPVDVANLRPGSYGISVLTDEKRRISVTFLKL